MSELKAAVVPVTLFQQNCSVWWNPETGVGAVVDPGGDLPMIRETVAKHNVTVEKVLVTHGHLDHAGGVADLAKEYNVPIEGPHKDDLFLIEGLADQGQRFGFSGAKSFETDRWLEGGDTVMLAGAELQVRHCPGHTPGHVVFIHPESKISAVGDVLFRGSVGRSDLPGGDHNQLINSIRGELWPLGNDITFIPGHGPLSTFGQERIDNPFVADYLFS